MIARASRPTLIVTRVDHPHPQGLFSALGPNPPLKRQRQLKRQTNQLPDTIMSRIRRNVKIITATMVALEFKVALWAYNEEKLSLTKHLRTKGRTTM